MKHLSLISKTPRPAFAILRAFLQTKRDTIEYATNLKDIF